MSLIKCPSCQKQISNKLTDCPNCNFLLNQPEDELKRLKILNYRKYRNKMYRLKMLSFAAIAIAVFGIVPMLWAYVQAIDYGFNANITNHWGIYLIMIGFVLYVIIRVLMLSTKRNYKANR